MKSKYPKEHSTVDKVRCGNLSAEKSRFVWEATFREGEEFESKVKINFRELRLRIFKAISATVR